MSRHERDGVAGGQPPCGACGHHPPLPRWEQLRRSWLCARRRRRDVERERGCPRHHGTRLVGTRQPHAPGGPAVACVSRSLRCADGCPSLLTVNQLRNLLTHSRASPYRSPGAWTRPTRNERETVRGVGWLTARQPHAPAPPAEDRIRGEGASRSPAAVSRISRRRALLTRRCGRPPATARLRALSRRRREDAGGPVADTTPRERHLIFPPVEAAPSPFGAVSAGARAGRLDWIGSAPHTGRGGIVHAKAASFFIPPRPAPRLRSKAAEVRHIPRRARAGPPVAGRPGIVTEKLPAPPPPPALPYGWRLT